MRDNPAFSMVHESDEETEAMLQQPDSGPIFSINLNDLLSQIVSLESN